MPTICREASPRRVRAWLFSSILLVLLPLLVVGCDTFAGWKGASHASTPPSSVGSGDAGASDAAPSTTPPVDAGPTLAGPGPERVVVRAGYVGADDPVSATLEIDRQGTFRLERRGEPSEPGRDAGRDPGVSSCKGSLPTDVVNALWKAVDAGGFAPAEGGFAKPIQAPRQQGGPAGGPQASYSVIRMLEGLAMVPTSEATARALVAPVRTALVHAEKQTSGPGACTKLPPR